jgi:hypothetical protein
MSLLDFGTAQAAESAQRSTLRAFAAPFASGAGAVVEELDDLDVAYAVLDAYGHSEGEHLGRSDLADACLGVCTPARFESRFEVYVKLGMLVQKRSKAHQQVYALNPTASASLAVMDRISRAGGVQDILLMLDATVEAIKAGTASLEQVASALHRARAQFSVQAQHLTALVETATFAELLTQRRQHQQGALVEHAQSIVKAVVGRFPDLRGSAARLVESVNRYQQAVSLFYDRVSEEGHAKRDFTMLSADQYLTAATRAAKEALAAPFERVLFDRPNPLITAETVVAAVDRAKPRPVRRRPPPPVEDDPASFVDPVDASAQRAAANRRTLMLAMEQHLQGATDVDMTSRVRGAPWPAAVVIVADLLTLRGLPYVVVVSDALIVDPDAAVTVASPIALHRARAGADPTTDVRGLSDVSFVEVVSP